MCGRKGLLQGRHADIRRLGRPHRHLPVPQHRLDTGSVTTHPLSAEQELLLPGSAVLRAPEQVLGLAEGNPDPDTHLAGYGEIDFEGAAQTASSVATNSFNPRMRQLSLELDRTDLGLHFLAGQSWSLNAPVRAGIDPRGVDAPGVIDFESVPGFLAARNPAFASGRTSDQSSSWPRRSKIRRPPSSAATCRRSARRSWPTGVLNPNLQVNLTGPGGSFFNNLNNSA